METNNKQLTANSLICDFSDAQLRQAMEPIDGERPLLRAMRLIDAMGDYIVFNEGIDQQIRNAYLEMDSALQFYLKLVKMTLGNEN